MKLLFIDCETTGLDPDKHALIQVAAIIEIDGQVKEELNVKMKPYKGQLVSGQALETTGIKLADLEGFPAPEEGYKQILGLFDRYIDKFNKLDKFHMVGQNPRFDHEFLNEFFYRNGNEYLYSYIKYHLIDLVALSAAMIMAGKMPLKDMKLETVATHLGIEHDAHDALSDIRVTREIFYRYINFIKASEAKL